MAHRKVHVPVLVSARDADTDIRLKGCKTKIDICGAWATGVTELTLFSYDNSGEVQYNHTTVVTALGCTACQFGRNVHPLAHEEIGNTTKSSNWSLGIYDDIDEALDDAITVSKNAIKQATVEIAQTAINRKDSKSF